MRRAYLEIFMSAGAVALLLIALVSVDGRVREEIWLRVSSNPSAEIASAGRHAHDLGALIVDAVRDQSIAHAPLLFFTLTSAVLVVFMLRT